LSGANRAYIAGSATDTRPEIRRFRHDWRAGGNPIPIDLTTGCVNICRFIAQQNDFDEGRPSGRDNANQ
jgi:hypothetical protein